MNAYRSSLFVLILVILLPQPILAHSPRCVPLLVTLASTSEIFTIDPAKPGAALRLHQIWNECRAKDLIRVLKRIPNGHGNKELQASLGVSSPEKSEVLAQLERGIGYHLRPMCLDEGDRTRAGGEIRVCPWPYTPEERKEAAELEKEIRRVYQGAYDKKAK